MIEKQNVIQIKILIGARTHLNYYIKKNNYTYTKEFDEFLKTATLELPNTPELQDIKKLVLNRDKIIEEQIIKPQNKLIKELHNENVALHKELSKQTEIIDVAEEFVKEKESLQNENKNLERTICLLQQVKNQDEEDLKFEYENRIDHIEHKYQKKIKELEKENKGLNKVIDKFKDNLKKFLKWLCHKFSYPCEDDLIRDFNKETYRILILKSNSIQAILKRKIMK